jgi:basic membrane protein A and related proteins
MSKHLSRWLAVIGLAGGALVACGNDDSASPTTTQAPATTAAPGTTAAPTTAPEPTEEPKKIAFLSAGDANDGGFYQSQVTPAREFAEARGWEFVLVDRVRPANAAAEMRNLARQNPDVVIAGGGTEHIDALVEVAPEYPDIAWLRLGGATPPTEHYASATQDYAEIHYLAGVGAALFLERSGGETIGFVAGPELPFTVVAHKGLAAGLKSRLDAGQVLVTHTGDFNDAGLAVEAARAQISAGADLMYGFLGGAIGAFIGEANSAGVPLAIQPEDRCGGGGFAMSVIFSQGRFAVGLLTAYAEGRLEMGTETIFRIGKDPEQVNVVLCDASAEEQAILDEITAGIASGAIDPQAAIASLG